MDATQTPEDDALAELDRLEAATREAPDDIPRQIALWRAVAGLDQWFFVDRGTPEQPRPYGLAAPNGQMVCVYSSGLRAREGAVTNGLVPADADVPVFSVPLPQAIDWMLSLAERGVVGITLDYPRSGAWCPVANLAGLRRDREGTGS